MRKEIYVCFGIWTALALAGCGAKETAGDLPETSGSPVIEASGQEGAAGESQVSGQEEAADGSQAAGPEGAANGSQASGQEGAANGGADETTSAPAPLNLEIKTEHEGEWKDGKALIRAENDTITVLDRDGHSELKTALNHYNKENRDSVLEIYNDSLETAKEFVTGENEGWYVERKIQIARADETVVSLWNTETAYLGGAHGSFYMNGETIDTATGTELELSDAVTDMDRVYEYVKTYLEENYDQEMFFPDYVETTLKPMFSGEGGEGTSPVEWVMDQEKLTFLFNPYVLGPWAAGSMTVYLPFEGNEDLIEARFRTAGPITAQRLQASEPFTADFDGDGAEETLTFQTTPEEEGYMTGVQVSVEKNGETKSAEESFYGSFREAWLMEPASGPVCLYLEFAGDNDWQHLEIFNLSGDEITYAGLSSPAFYGHSIPGADRFWLFERLDVLGTYMAYREYTVGEDGLPVPTEEIWSLADYAGGDGYTITSVREFSVQIDGKEEKLPAGTGFTLARTGGPAADGKTFVEAELSDGRICRIDLTRNEDSYFYEIDGVSEYDCFEALRYAG